VNRVEIIELVQQHHPHMGEVEIIKLINRAMDDFTINTHILKKYKDVYDTVAGQRYYPSTGSEALNETIGGNSDIIRIMNVWIDDVLIPRMASVNAAMLIDDDEFESSDNALDTPSKTSNERYWYPIDDSGIRLGLVEKSIRSAKRDDKISNYQSISETGLQIRLHYVARCTHLTASSTSGADFIPDISSIWHPALIAKAVAEGYKDPRNQKFDATQYFISEYQDYIKQAKREAKSNSIVSGIVVPYDY
jgi:hypothetical protein